MISVAQSQVLVPKDQWKWYGNNGHLIVGRDCQFHLCTEVGTYLVSTVGEYLPDESVREGLAQSRGVVLEGRGDNRRADYMEKLGFEDVGLNRKYETYVFDLAGGNRCEEPKCGCGLPSPKDWGEIDSLGANDAGEATRNHYEMCEKWSKIDPLTQGEER